MDSITSSDGVKLTYTWSGPASAPILLLVPGWSQTAAQWEKQIAHFDRSYNVISYDHRGHGESEKPNHGYRVARLGVDLNDLLVALDLKDVVIVGHSMGCAVIWAFWDLFPAARLRIKKLVLVDQPAVMTANPGWTPEYADSVSATLLPNTPYDVGNSIQSEAGKDFARAFIKSMFTSSLPESELDWIMEQNSKMKAEHAATLLADLGNSNWRDVLPRINVPTLVIAPKASIYKSEGIQWVASRIPGAKYRTFSEEEKGSHFVFWENPDLFNQVVEDFVKE